MNLVCNTCHQSKPGNAFSKDASSKTGHQRKCKTCFVQWKHDHAEDVAKKAQQRYKANKAAVIARVTQYNKDNPTKRKVWRDRWSEKQPKKVKQSRKEKSVKPIKAPWNGACIVCAIVKPFDAFTKDHQRKEGITHTCKTCENQRGARYRAAQGKALLQRHKAWRDGHPKNIRQSHKTYLDKHPGVKNSWTQNYRARKRGAFVEEVDQTTVYVRDQGMCQICHTRVPKTRKFPDPQSQSYDHIVPVSQGGEHSYRNVVLTHLHCNASKGNRSVPQQQRLF